MRPPTDDDRWEVAQRLERLGYPFGGERTAIEDWVNGAIFSGTIERTAVSESIMHGATIKEAARFCGITELRALHYLSRSRDQETSEHDPWRLVTAQETLED